MGFALNYHLSTYQWDRTFRPFVYSFRAERVDYETLQENDKHIHVYYYT